MRMWMLLIAAALLLAACATASTETPALPTLAETQPVSNTVPTDAQPTPDTLQPTLDPGATVDPAAQETPTVSALQQAIALLPPPGTMQVPVTEEPDPNATPVPFFNITYTETGGLSNTELLVDIFSDGRVIRNGTETSIPPETIAQLNQAIHDLNFFAIQGQFTMPGAGLDVYNYNVRVELQDGRARSLDAQDRVTPPELLRLFSLLRNIGV